MYYFDGGSTVFIVVLHVYFNLHTLYIQVRTSLATYSGQELDDRNQSVEEIDEYFQEDENEEEIEGCLADIPDILGDLGKKIKVDKIIMVRMTISTFGQSFLS